MRPRNHKAKEVPQVHTPGLKGKAMIFYPSKNMASQKGPDSAKMKETNSTKDSSRKKKNEESSAKKKASSP